MAKKKNKKSTKSTPVFENALPQNIVAVGERVEEDKKIYISQPVYKEIHKFTKNKTTNESGGMLIGELIEDFGKTNIIIKGFVEAKYCDATPTTLKFTHETWDYVHNEIDKKFPGQKILGWIHTHPDFGIFLSEYDKFIQENFFKEEYQVAYVIDPIQKEEGFYFWINEKIERCKGFYIFDKTGKAIETEATANDNEKADIQSERSALFTVKNFIIAILAVAVLFLSVSYSKLDKNFESLKNEYTNFAIVTNTNIQILLDEINNMRVRISMLEGEEQPQEDDSVDTTEPSTNEGEN